MPRHRPDSTLVAQRIADLARVRLDGLTSLDVSSYVMQQGSIEGSPWRRQDGEEPLSDRQMRRYLGRADQLIADTIDRDRDRQIALIVARHNGLYARAVNQGDLGSALSVLKHLCKLLALYPENTKAKTPEVVILTHEERRAALLALFAGNDRQLPGGVDPGAAGQPGRVVDGEARPEGEQGEHTA